MVTRLASLEAVARLAEIKINTRELVDEWVLITYDIPVTEAGKIARSKFLKTAPKIGAMMHSRSVYLIPNTSQAQAAALDLASTVGGEVYIWTSRMDEDQAKQVTSFYDNKINDAIENIIDRLGKQNELLLPDAEGRVKTGMAERMKRKTMNLYKQLLFTAAQRGVNAKVLTRLANIEKQLTS